MQEKVIKELTDLNVVAAEGNAHLVHTIWFTKNGRNHYQNYVGLSKEEIAKGWENITKADKRYKLITITPFK